MKKIIILLLVAVSVYSCEKEGLYSKAPKHVNKQKILDLVNKVRTSGTKRGGVVYKPVGKVSWSNVIEKAAQIHSNDMDEHSNFSHTGSNGSSVGERLKAVGYKWNYCSENIAAGYSTEELVIEGWLNSPGHCENIMSANVTKMAVATSGIYWTQVFAK